MVTFLEPYETHAWHQNTEHVGTPMPLHILDTSQIVWQVAEVVQFSVARFHFRVSCNCEQEIRFSRDAFRRRNIVLGACKWT
jgi:hypothetical protein